MGTLGIRVLLSVMSVFAIYLAFSQISVNALLPYAYVAGLLIFIGVSVYKHASEDHNYRMDGRTFWLDLVSIILIVGISIQLSGKALAV